MGCQSSQADKPLGIRVNIIDSNFTKQDNSHIRSRMDKLDIKYEVYLSMPCFIQDMLKAYTNQVIVTEDMLCLLIKELENAHFHPNIYVIKSSTTNPQTQIDPKFPVKYLPNYDTIISQLTDRTQKKRISNLNPAFQKNKENIVLKIFRKKEKNSTQAMIFQQTLKTKKISYQVYDTFSQLQESLQKKNSNFIVTDYVYHREVINLVENTPTRVMCYCEFDKDQTYDSRAYFVTNNFLEIVSEIVSQQKVSKMQLVKCSKVYIYSQTDSLSQYAHTLQKFDFQVKIYSDLQAILKQSIYYFAVTLIINPEERKQVEQYLEKNDYMFKTKIIEIKKGTPNTVQGLRKVIKQLKKGYRASKGLTKTIDIIDKHFDNVKFDSIKKQLDKSDIKCYGYKNLNDYIKKKKFMSSFIICNYQQHSIVLRYLKQIKSMSKLILFCNKNHISTELKQDKQFAFVNSHFGKIINFIKQNKVYSPYILDQNQIQIKNKKQKLNKNNKRISALNWSNATEMLMKHGEEHQQGLNELEKKFEFLNVNEGTSVADIYAIQKEFCSLFNLQYSPMDCPHKLRENFVASLRKLKTILKISYPQGQFQSLISQVQQFNTWQMITRIMGFFSSQNQMGFKINKSLINIESLSQQQIVCLKQYMLYVNMNFITVYRDPFVGRIKLYRYMKSQLIEKCQVGSSIFNKNYCIFYESDQQKEQGDEAIAPYRIELDMEVDPISSNDPMFNSYFRYNEKFIFCPYSQFQIKSIQKVDNQTVIQVQYKKNVDYLKYYFEYNLHKQRPTLLALCEQQLQKSKTTTSPSFFFDDSTKDQFSRNLLRTKAITSYHTDKVDEAIKCQKELIFRQENLDNFDSAKQQWLNYELACYHFKGENHQECKRILKQVMEGEPNEFIRDKIRLLTRNFRKSTQESIIPQVEERVPQQVRKSTKHITNGQKQTQTIQLDQMEDKEDSEGSSQRNIFEMIQDCHEVPCLDFEMLQNFENEQKENFV